MDNWSNFEPIQKISANVFKKRNFSDIQFADLHDLLEINGDRYYRKPDGNPFIRADNVCGRMYTI